MNNSWLADVVCEANKDLQREPGQQRSPDVVSVNLNRDRGVIEFQFATKEWKEEKLIDISTGEATLSALFFGVVVNFTGTPAQNVHGCLVLQLDSEWLKAALADVRLTAATLQRGEFCTRQEIEREELKSRLQLRAQNRSKPVFSLQVNTMLGVCLVENLVEDDTCEVIKERLWAMADIAPECQTLWCNDEQVHNAHLVKDLGVKHGEKLYQKMDMYADLSLLSLRKSVNVVDSGGYERLMHAVGSVLWSKLWFSPTQPVPTLVFEVASAIGFLPYEWAHWYLRCSSPNPHFVWSPENDKNWPLLFRKVIRLLTRIRVPQGSGENVTLPLPLLSNVARFL